MDKIRTAASQYGMAFVLLALIALFSALSPVFFTYDNLSNVLRQSSMLGIAAVGMTFVILTGGIDLSVGSVVALTGVLTALAMQAGLGILPSCIIGLIGASFVGVVNGVAITRFRIPALIATLATLSAVRGLSYILSGGLPIFGFPAEFNVLGRGMIGVVPVPVLILFIFVFIGWIVINRTQFGRRLYAIGGNVEAARLSGVPVTRNILITYVISALFAGCAGIIILSRLNSAQPNNATGFELDVITAVVLGGISIAGGHGRFIGVVFGVFVIGVLSNGMVLLNVQDYYQMVIKGAVLMFAVGLDQYSSDSNAKTARRKRAAAILSTPPDAAPQTDSPKN